MVGTCRTIRDERYLTYLGGWTYPDDVGVLFEPLAARGDVHNLAPDAGLAVLPDGCLSPPTVAQRNLQHGCNLFSFLIKVETSVVDPDPPPDPSLFS
jgi:hypothetical protein